MADLSDRMTWISDIDLMEVTNGAFRMMAEATRPSDCEMIRTMVCLPVDRHFNRDATDRIRAELLLLVAR